MKSFRVRRPRIPPRLALSHLARTLNAAPTWHALRLKLGHDRVLMRSSALAYDTLLSVVPMTAVIMAATRALGGSAGQDALLRYVAEQYVPAAAGGAVERLLPLIDHLDLRTIGIVGLAALLPVIYTLVDAVEGALSDIFGTPRRKHWWRLLLLGGLLTLAPVGSLLTVRYAPWSALGLHHLMMPIVSVTLLLFGVFRGVPSGDIRSRAALTGAITAAVMLSIAKAAFGLYALYLARSIHLLWGAIAFVPLLLVWVLVAWFIVLLGAEVASVLQHLLGKLEEPGPDRPRPSHPRSRLRRRLARTPDHPQDS